MFEQVVGLVGSVPVAPSDRLTPAQLLDRITATERAIAALQAEQARDLAAFSDRRVAADVADGVPDHLVGRSIGTEVGLALGVGQQAAASRVAQAWVTVRHHPWLLDRLGTGQVTWTGLRLVLKQTEALDEADRRVVDAQVADIAETAAGEPLTPARLAQAAARCALSVDPDAAAKRAATARSRRRVWLGEPVDGVAGIGAVLRAEESLACWTVLDRTARNMRSDGDDRSVQQLVADLFVERLTGTALVRVPAPDPARDPARDPAGAEAGGGTGVEAGEKEGVQAGVPGWRNVHGWEPWTATPPPPLLAPVDCRVDPDPDEPVWDTYCDPSAPPVDHASDPKDSQTARAHRPETGQADGSVVLAGRDAPGVDPPQRPPPPDRHPPDTPADRPADRPAGQPADDDPQWRLPANVELQVVMSAETLLGLDDEPAMLRGPAGMAAYGQIAADVARNIADVAARRTLIGLFADPVDGRLLTMDSTARCYTGRLRDFCLWRDQVCRMAGGRIGHLDHRHEVHAGGDTTARNGQSLSQLSHRLKDHPAITGDIVDAATLDGNGNHGQEGPKGLDHVRANAPTLAWTMPTGHRYTSTPPPALGPGARPDPQHWADQIDERQAYKEFVTECDRTAGRLRSSRAVASG